MNKKRGFTIVELVIVVAVIGILSAILIPTFSGLSNTAKENALQHNLTVAYEQYSADASDSEHNIEQVSMNAVYLVVENGDVTNGDTLVYKRDAQGKWIFVALASRPGTDADGMAKIANSGVYGGYEVYKATATV